MKELPDEKTMLEALEEARLMEKAAREMCEMAFAVAHTAQKRVSEFRSLAASQKQEVTGRES